ncbi:phosphodiester glycosidase family protein [Myxococcota bacterium]|nr:phosphodiester glycosidase family protein [Myxococcota bacterium]
MRRHLVPLLASMGLAAGLAVLAHGALRGASAPVPADLGADDAASVERRAREALLAHLRSLGYQADATESAGFIDLFRDGAPGDPAAVAESFVERRFVFLARTASQPNRDVYLLRARIAPTGEPLALGAVHNLTRTTDGDEAWLTPRPGQVAFTTRFANHYTGVTVLDLNGAPPAPGAGLAALVTQALTDLVEMGDWRGANVIRFVLPEPAAELRLHWEGDELVVARRESLTWGEARLDLAGRGAGQATAAPWLRAVETQRAPRSLLSWAVDTARSLPFIGPERIYALEEVFFRLADLFQTTRYKLLGGSPAGLDAAAAPTDAAAPTEAEPSAEAPETAGVEDPHGPWPIERPPADIVKLPVVDPVLPGEGHWRPFTFGAAAGRSGAPPLFWRTTLRADPERPDAITELVLADGRQVALKMVGGTEHPRSSTGEVGTGRVPAGDRDSTLAAFNGGFQAIHGGYGMAVDRTVLLPPVPDVATVATYTDGSVRFGTWATRPALPAGLVSLRQNLPPLVDAGRFNPLEQRTWGFTLKGRDPIFTWRSGLGVTRSGHLLFAVCVRCSADTLADAMLAADVDYAMHLDMNISNIGWEWWRQAESRGGIERASLMRDMWRSDEPRYTDSHTRDFFYLVRRPLVPTGPGVVWQRAPTGEGVPRPAGLWPPPVIRGVLDVEGRAVTAVRLATDTLGAALVEAGPDRAPPGTFCRLSLHRGVMGEGLPWSSSGEAPQAERGALVVDGDGRMRVQGPGGTPDGAAFYQQLPAVLVAGEPTATTLAGPNRFALGADPSGGLWLVGGEVEMSTLTSALGRLGVRDAVAPAPRGGHPALRCGASTLVDGPPPASAHDLALGRARTPPPSMVRRTTAF